MKKIILFDFFGVVSSEVAPKWFSRFFNDEDAKIIKEDLIAPADLGKKTEEQIYRDVAAVCKVNADEVRHEWYRLAVIDKHVVEYIQELRKSHPVYLLSNATDTFLKTIIYKNKLENLFDRIYISSELKLAKPDPSFFIHCISDIGASPDDCVMIDDNPKNIAAAESIGISGIVYTEIEDLKKKLETIQ